MALAHYYVSPAPRTMLTHTHVLPFFQFFWWLWVHRTVHSAHKSQSSVVVYGARGLCSMRRSIYRYFMPINEVLHLALDWNARFHHQQSVGKITIIMKWNYRWPRNGWLSNESTRQYEPAKSKRNSLAHHQSSIHLDCSNLNQFKCVQQLLIHQWHQSLEIIVCSSLCTIIEQPNLLNPLKSCPASATANKMHRRVI